MSIVGPRPERPEIAAEYEKEMPEFRLRLQARAGLTGYAQVYGKYNTTPYDKLQMDLQPFGYLIPRMKKENLEERRTECLGRKLCSSYKGKEHAYVCWKIQLHW